MKRLALLIICLLCMQFEAIAQTDTNKIDSIMPTRGIVMDFTTHLGY